MAFWQRLLGGSASNPEESTMEGHARCFCYRSKNECRQAFDRLKRGDVRGPLPRGGRVELRTAHTALEGCRHWLVCINMPAGPWEGGLLHHDCIYDTSTGQVRAESRQVDAFGTPGPAPIPEMGGDSAADGQLPERPARERAKPPDFVNPVDSYEMVLVPAGKAIFGSGEDERDPRGDSKPQFRATLQAYYLGRYCVTNAQYAGFLTATQPGPEDVRKWILSDSFCRVRAQAAGYVVDEAERYGDHPVIGVSWFGAEAYCAWAGLRLPSELEWEKGARGAEGLAYPWGNEWNSVYCHCPRRRGCELTCPVWQYPEGASPWGCYNMSGSALEWCADWYLEHAYRLYAKGDLTPPSRGSAKVVRGGLRGHYDPATFRAACRYSRLPHDCLDSTGFRCARSL